MHCLWCGEKILPEVTWLTFLIPQKNEVVCEECKEKLSTIKGSVCIRCNRPMEKEGGTCYDCQRWEKQSPALDQNVSVYEYTPFLQEVISKWKYRGDYVLAELFREEVQQRFKEGFGHQEENIIVPVPLSEERFNERGFNQAEALATLLHSQPVHALKRVHSEKQSKKSRKERMSSTNPFQIQEMVDGNVVLLDDIYTTGRTLHHAADILKKHGATAVSSFTLIRG